MLDYQVGGFFDTGIGKWAPLSRAGTTKFKNSLPTQLIFCSLVSQCRSVLTKSIRVQKIEIKVSLVVLQKKRGYPSKCPVNYYSTTK